MNGSNNEDTFTADALESMHLGSSRRFTATKPKKQKKKSSRTTMFWATKARKVAKPTSLAAQKFAESMTTGGDAFKEDEEPKKVQAEIKKPQTKVNKIEKTHRGNEKIMREQFKNTTAVRKKFTHGKNISIWQKVETGSKRETRYLEFIVTAKPPDKKPPSDIFMKRHKRKGVKAEERKVKGEQSNQKFKRCALCEMSFVAEAVSGFVTRRGVHRLREKWRAKKQAATGYSEKANDESLTINHSRKTHPARMYDAVSLCIFCSQFFSEFDKDFDTRYKKISKQGSKKHRETSKFSAAPSIVTVSKSLKSSSAAEGTQTPRKIMSPHPVLDTPREKIYRLISRPGPTLTL